MRFAAPFLILPSVITALLSLTCGRARADEPAAFPVEQVEFFENSVRPLLVHHCQECHGPQKQEGKLRLDSRASVIAGGETGPAAVAGDPEHSLLVAALHYKEDGPQMPPKGRLDGDKVAILEKWVKLGLPWGKDAAPSTAVEPGSFRIDADDRAWCAFQPIASPPLPAVRNSDWPRRTLDHFILAKLEAAGRAPNGAAAKRVLLRRLTFDLTGLPPTPEEAAAFLADESPHAYERVVERLLASPHYGERMARFWLDIARYGEDQAHTFQARKYPQGFRYRDWVVASFNTDRPYDDFIKQQIAADLIEGPDQRERLAALGYFACGPVYYGDKNQMDQVADRIDTLSRGFLGLTVACARCHDHKFDPISTVDYYALAGVFASTEYDEVPLVSAEEIAAHEAKLTDEEKKQKNRPKPYPFLHALKEASQPKNLRVHVRGNSETLGEEAPRRFMEVLSSDAPAPFQTGSGRRELAEKIASAENPLTARVFVNRLWQWRFGRGLVATSSNFGHLGERPSHPELLDHLAAQFIKSNWSIKQLDRELVLSATYQQSSACDEAAREADPQNILMGRMPLRRLEVEAWRDALLVASGQLELSLGGPSLELAASDNRRRTLYGSISRHELNDLLRLFDFPDPNITSDQRVVTTVALQQLFVLNSDFMAARAKALATRLHAEAPADDAARIRRAYELLFLREPTEAELTLGTGFLAGADPSDKEAPRLTRWERYAQLLLSTNEFMYLE